MKKEIWLILSVTFNVILAGILLTARHRALASGGDREAVAAMSSAPLPPPRTRLLVSSRPVSSEAANTVNGEGDSKSGTQFTGDFRSLVSRLRAQGVSEELIVNLVAGEVQRQLQIQQRELQKRWRRGEITQREMQALMPSWNDEMERGITGLLGPEGYRAWQRNNMLPFVDIDALGLSEAEINAGLDVMSEQRHRTSALQRAGQLGEIDPIDLQEQTTALQKEYDRELSALLGEDRYLKVKQSTDSQYNRLRDNLRDMNLSEAQLDAAYRIEKDFQEKQQELQRLSRAGELKTAGSPNPWQALQEQKEQQYEQTFGATGYAEYKKLQDNRYQQMNQYAPAWQLNKPDIDHVWQAMQEYRESVKDYRKQVQDARKAGERVDSRQVQDGLRDFTQETERDLRNYLGDERFTKLKRAGIIRLENQP